MRYYEIRGEIIHTNKEEDIFTKRVLHPLEALRIEKKLPQLEMSLILNISQAKVCKIERGITKINGDEIVKVAISFGIDQDIFTKSIPDRMELLRV